MLAQACEARMLSFVEHHRWDQELLPTVETGVFTPARADAGVLAALTQHRLCVQAAWLLPHTQQAVQGSHGGCCSPWLPLPLACIPTALRLIVLDHTPKHRDQALRLGVSPLQPPQVFTRELSNTTY